MFEDRVSLQLSPSEVLVNVNGTVVLIEKQQLIEKFLVTLHALILIINNNLSDV